MQKLKSVRKYNEDLKLVHELYNQDIEIINKYDDRGNLIYTKSYCICTNSIEYEYEQKFDDNNRLIYLNRINIGESFYNYDDSGNLIYYHYASGSYSEDAIFDNLGRRIKDVDNKGNILKEYLYNDKLLVKILDYYSESFDEYEYKNNTVIITTKDLETNDLLSYNINDINGNCIYKYKPKMGLSNEIEEKYFYDIDNKLIREESTFFGNRNIIYDNKNRIISVIYENNKNGISQTKYEYDSKGQLLTQIDFDLDNNISLQIDYENIYED